MMKDQDSDVVEVTRTLRYRGPRWWIRDSMARRVVHPEGTNFKLLPENGLGAKRIEEISYEERTLHRERQRFVQVAYIDMYNGVVERGDSYDYIDGEAIPLKAGERVYAPRVNGSTREGIVMGLGKGQAGDWPYQTATRVQPVVG